MLGTWYPWMGQAAVFYPSKRFLIRFVCSFCDKLIKKIIYTPPTLSDIAENMAMAIIRR